MTYKRDRRNQVNTAIGLSNVDTVSKFGSATAEFLKGLRGVDHESGVFSDRSLIKVSQSKVNCEFVEQNLKQQAGYSAEIASTSRKNAQSIIEGSKARYSRSEDVPSFGKNDPVVDIVELLDGSVESTAQMKFVGDDKLGTLLNKIADGSNKSGKNDLSRYLEVDELQLPTNQVERAKDICRERATKLREQANRLRENGNIQLADQKEQVANNYNELEKKISDSKLTSDEAMQYRLEPNKMTAKDIVRTSHKAGVEGAKFGVAIGGSISLITNLIAVSSGNKELSEAAIDTVIDTTLSAGVGYVSAFSGSALKGMLQQSSSEYTRALSATALPALVVSVCIACGSSVLSYTSGDIEEAELLQNIGGSVGGMLSSSMFASIGQLAIPIPILGGLVGGMVGYTLSNLFYQGFLSSLDDAKKSREQLELIRNKCLAAKQMVGVYQNRLDEIFSKKISQLNDAKEQLFSALNQPNVSVNQLCNDINLFALLLEKELQFQTQAEFDDFMSGDDTLEL
ncbi:hypothetical protein VFA_000477 [Vibrio furnissii CIP 102972]|uniref:hypothetical protein n=1 Tax=Vibrio furnissii TaxID=29494 RepID=UPI0001B953AA|nr:hypothetical protein [Vibrio furnissii]EEX42720.1 hypothetical protein VFA_000477 [Vibrio furnissii CIP 102972]QDC92104.1 hypothetical protein FIU11_04995 [Vibrio furnissii]UON49255.1 hypothetical protein IUJ52_05995 [Vibrio furnissii]SUP43707.1 Uncharacterised protein [Vibrio furnissii]